MIVHGSVMKVSKLHMKFYYHKSQQFQSYWRIAHKIASELGLILNLSTDGHSLGCSRRKTVSFPPPL
jgi:hypothetical protein